MNARLLHECLAAGHFKCVSAGPCGLDWIGLEIRQTRCCIVNVALRRPAVQSSTYDIAVASFAVDGNLASVSCTLWSASSGPWWSVDLGTRMNVARVTVTNDHNENYGEHSLR